MTAVRPKTMEDVVKNEKLSAMAGGTEGGGASSTYGPLPRAMSYDETVRLVADRPELFDDAELEECRRRVRARRGA